jgi:hypothetical protein
MKINAKVCFNTVIHEYKYVSTIAFMISNFASVSMPLQVAYVNEIKYDSKKPRASFAFGSGTLQGHLLVSFLHSFII